MNITKKTDYAIRCILYLSSQAERISTITEVAENMSVPKTFLAKIFQLLAKAGYVESIRGVNGGFQLIKNPEEIKLLDVIDTMQGVSAINTCAVDKKSCKLSYKCSVHPIWIELNALIRKKLKNVNFAKLAKKY